MQATPRETKPNTPPSLLLFSFFSLCMMSHSHQHPQPQQRRLLSQCLNQLREHPAESSFSSSQTHYKTKIPLCLIHSETTSTPTHSFFGPKIVSSSPHQHYYFHEPHSPSSFPCCFNVSSRRWSAFKLGCTSMDPQVEFSSSLHSASEIIVSLLISSIFLSIRIKDKYQRFTIIYVFYSINWAKISISDHSFNPSNIN